MKREKHDEIHIPVSCALSNRNDSVHIMTSHVNPIHPIHPIAKQCDTQANMQKKAALES